MSNNAGPSSTQDDTDSESGISSTNSETDTSTGDGGDGGDGGDMSSKSGTFQAGDATGGSADLGNQSSGSGGPGGGGGDQQNTSTASTNGQLQAPASSAGSGNGARTGVPAQDSLNLDSSNPTVAGDSSDSSLSAGGGRGAGTTRTTSTSQEDSAQTICLGCGGVPASQGAGQGAFGEAEQGRGASAEVPGESLAGRVDPVATLVLAGVLVLMAIRTAAKVKFRSRPGRPSAPVA